MCHDAEWVDGPNPQSEARLVTMDTNIVLSLRLLLLSCALNLANHWRATDALDHPPN